MTPYKHQTVAIAEAEIRKMLALFYETGTGKTMIAIRVLENWFNNGLRQLICVVPNSLTGVWIDEAANFESTLRFVRVPAGRAARVALIHDTDSWDVLVINYEGARTLWEELVSIDPQGLVMDEMQRVKDRRAGQTKACRMIARVVKAKGGRILGMTGTPIVHRPTDLWSEFDVLWPHGKDPREHLLGYGNYYAFESAVAIVRPHPRLGLRVKLLEFPQDRLNELRKRVAPYALEATKADCLDLPERTFQTVRLDMEPEQERIYKALKEDMVAYLDNDKNAGGAAARTLSDYGVRALNEQSYNPDAIFIDDEEAGDDRRVSVAFATTLLIRLQQIAAGFVVKDDKTIVDLPNVKLKYLEEMLPQWASTDGDHKAILFCRFKHDAKILAELCDKLKIGHVLLTGETSKEASSIVEQFQTEPRVRVFIGNIQVASVGITLTAADYCCFYDNSFALGDKLQAIDRCYRIGQKRVVTYYDLVARGTVDETALANLREKRSLATATVRNLKEALL